MNNTASYNNVGQKLVMSDPDKGNWQYQYNALGELIKQTDAAGQVTTFVYDMLGRLKTRAEGSTTVTPTTVASWTYDNQTDVRCANQGLSAANLGLPTKIVKTGELSKVLCHDGTGRTVQSYWVLTGAGQGGLLLQMGQHFDPENRIDKVDYPYSYSATQTYAPILSVQTNYDDAGSNGAPGTGIATTLIDTQTGTTLEQSLLMDAFGNVTQTALNKNNSDAAIVLDEQRWFDVSDGRLLGICTQVSVFCGSPASAQALQGLDYGQSSGSGFYDVFGNLTKQVNAVNGVTESFSYDARQRLVQSTRSGASALTNSTLTYSFDAFGNLLAKSDYANQMQYVNQGLAANSINDGTGGAYGPHQVAHVLLANNNGVMDYDYDANGNLTDATKTSGGVPAAFRHIDYNRQMQPTLVTQSSSGAYANYQYDEAGERFYEKHFDPPTNKTTKIWKIGKQWEYQVATVGSTVSYEQKFYVGGHAMLRYYPTSQLRKWTYLLTDRLGSVDTDVDPKLLIANSISAVEHHGFDPFGKPRDANWNQYTQTGSGLSALNSTFSTRGFTGHDAQDEIGLVNMNGRLYDADLGRMLEVDPFITDPLNAQTMNPYSYVNNSPLMGTDPTGYATEGCGTHIKGHDAVGCSGGSSSGSGKGEGIYTTNNGGVVAVGANAIKTVNSAMENGAKKKQEGRTEAEATNIENNATVANGGGGNGETLNDGDGKKNTAPAYNKEQRTKILNEMWAASGWTNEGPKLFANETDVLAYQDEHMAPIGLKYGIEIGNSVRQLDNCTGNCFFSDVPVTLFHSNTMGDSLDTQHIGTFREPSTKVGKWHVHGSFYSTTNNFSQNDLNRAVAGKFDLWCPHDRRSCPN